MIAVGFDEACERITISNAGQTFAPRSINLSRTGSRFTLRVRGQDMDLIAADYSAFTDAQGQPFASVDQCEAYLAAVLTRYAWAGDRFAIPIAITARGQTVIPFPAPPSSAASVRLAVNGVAYRVPDIAVSTIAVTWLSPDFALDPTDSVTLIYS